MGCGGWNAGLIFSGKPVHDRRMNWYFEEQGVSKGPFPESEFAQMVQRRDVPADSLVWRPGLDEWATVSAINPPWLGNSAAATEPEPKKQKVVMPPKKSSPLKETLPQEPPVIEAAMPVEHAAPVRGPAQSKLKPQAPTPAAGQAAPPEKKNGLLKRVFGFGGKKKS